MGCGQSVATQGGPIYEMTFDMTNSSPMGSTLYQGLALVEDDQSLLSMVEGLPDVSAGSESNGAMRIPGRLIRVTPLPHHGA
jgi:hypothetical protein